MSTTANKTTSHKEEPLQPEAAPRPGAVRRVLRRLLKWARNALLVLVALVVLVVLAGQVQQFRLARAYPPPGELVQVGDHKLHVMRAGEGPTVVFENGPGGMGIDWSLVMPEVSEFATTIAYDRAGLGWSEPASGSRDIATLVTELNQMLQATGATPPYVLVGHSYGGLIVRAYAYTYPEDVAGLVLVDAAHEDQFEIYPEEYAAKAENIGQQMASLRLVYRLVTGSGVPALLGAATKDVSQHLPTELGEAREAATLIDSSHSVAATDEMTALPSSLDHVKQIRAPLGDIPVIILTHGRLIDAGVPEGLEEEVEAAWQAMQTNLLEISTDSSLTIAEQSGHNIHVEQPELVIEAIREVLGR